MKNDEKNLAVEEVVEALKDQPDFDEKEFYDNVIKPKMMEVYKLCNEHNIPAIWYANPKLHEDNRIFQMFVTGSLDRKPLQFLLAHHFISNFTPKLAVAVMTAFEMIDDMIASEQKLPKIDD